MKRKLAFESLSRLNFERLEDRRVLAATMVDGPALSSSVDPQAVTTRDAAYWPFSSDSPYNTSIGSAAQFATISSPVYSSTGGAALNMQQWSIPVFVASSSDPVRSFYRGSTLIASGVHTPDAATPDSQSDGTLVVIDGTKAVEMWQATKRSDGNWTASQTVITDLTGSNVYSGYHGIRAGGMSALGGLIRADELANLDIEHALAVAVAPSGLNKMVDGQAVGFVWPASWADGSSTPGANYGTSGNLHMGSLLAIPPTVNINNLGLSTQGLALANTMQNYGAYIVETGNTNIAYYAEPAAASVAERGLATQLAKLTPYLQVVTNNGPTSVGGGGTHLPAAPPIGDGTTPPTATYSVSGVVTGTSGVALSGAQVAMVGGPTVTTNTQGQYSFGNLAAGDYTVNVSATNYNSQSTVAHVTTSNVTLDFALSAVVAPPPVALFVISGVVTGDNGAALPGAQVVLAGGPTVTTNAQGQYSFSNLAAGDYTLSVSATGYNSQSTVVQISATNVTLDFALSAVATPPAATYSVSGVVRGTGGVALSGAQVALAGGPTVTTNTQGQYSFGNLAAGDYTISVSATNYTSQSTVAHVTTSNITLNFALSAVVAPPPATTFTISGVVTGNNGVPYAGAWVHLADPLWASFIKIQTDAQGHYSFDNVAAGNWIVAVWTADFPWKELPVTVTDGNVALNIALGTNTAPAPDPPPVQTFTVSGTITDTNGNVLSNMTVYLYSGTTLLQSVTTNSFGRYSFANVEPGTYRIDAGGQGTNYGLSERTLTVDGDTTLNLSLTPNTKGRGKGKKN